MFMMLRIAKKKKKKKPWIVTGRCSFDGHLKFQNDWSLYFTMANICLHILAYIYTSDRAQNSGNALGQHPYL